MESEENRTAQNRTEKIDVLSENNRTDEFRIALSEQNRI